MAVLPVHTKPERMLFKALLLSLEHTGATGREPEWQSLTREWNAHCDGKEIRYKVRMIYA